MSLECSECERDLRGGHDPECSRYEDPRDAVCEKASDYLLALGTPEFARLNGGTEKLLQELRDAVFAWEHPDGL
jgi:hypothetical protein